MSRPAVPAHLRALLDDATGHSTGISTRKGSVEDAVHAHQLHRRSDHADVLGPLVVSDSALPELVPSGATGSTAGAELLEVLVVVSGGAGAIAPAVTWATGDGAPALRGLQVAVRESDAGDLAPNVRRIVTAVDSLVASGALDEDVPVYVEPPPLPDSGPTSSWLSALDEVAAMDHRLALRLDGAEGGPAKAEVAAWIGAALDRELSFRCTAGADHPVRHREPGTGREHHGFLNLLVATRASLDGAGTADVAAVLDETDAESLLAAVDATALASARRWLVSCGCGDVLGAVRELTDLGLLAVGRK